MFVQIRDAPPGKFTTTILPVIDSLLGYTGLPGGDATTMDDAAALSWFCTGFLAKVKVKE